MAVFDIDGVLADVGHRVHFLEQRIQDWRSFFAEAVHDPPLVEGVALAQEAAKECELLYLTGRPERCREDTLQWLKDNDLPPGDLHMRPDRDHRPARRLKPKVLREVAVGRTVAIVVDDDLEVCDAYEASGWTVLRADWASRSPALQKAQEEEGRT